MMSRSLGPRRTQVGKQDPAECFLCAAHRSPARPWHDRPVVSDPEGGVALPAMGALSPGHVLVTPAQHATAVQRLDCRSREAFAELLAKAIAQVSSAYGPVTVFEHSAPMTTETPRSACTDHAHVQIVPRIYPLDRDLPGGEHRGSLWEFYTGALPHDGYVMTTSKDGGVLCAPDTGVSQYFRRRIAQLEGQADEWDYMMFPRWGHMQETLSVLGAC